MNATSKTKATLTFLTHQGPLLQKVRTEPFEGLKLHEILTKDRSFFETGFRVKYVDSLMDYSDDVNGTCVSTWVGLIEQDIGSYQMEILFNDGWRLIDPARAAEDFPFLPDLMKRLIENSDTSFRDTSDFAVPQVAETA